MTHPIIHVEFQVKDVQKAMQWYSTLFGWETSFDASTNYGMFNADNDSDVDGGFNLITEHPVGTVAYVATDDIHGMVAKAQEHGARLVQDVTQIQGKGFYAVLSDPDGNAIGLWQRES